jgi:hypothetical protein
VFEFVGRKKEASAAQLRAKVAVPLRAYQELCSSGARTHTLNKPALSETSEREAIVQAWAGAFQTAVMAIEERCRINGVDNPWVASHWFDRGFIGFEDSGRLIISPVAHLPPLKRMGIDFRHPFNVCGFTAGQRRFLDFHRDKALLRSLQ